MKRRGDRPAKVRHDTHPVRVVAKAKPPPFDGAKSITTFDCFYDKLAVISGLLGKAFIFFHAHRVLEKFKLSLWRKIPHACTKPCVFVSGEFLKESDTAMGFSRRLCHMLRSMRHRR